jgi:hypothetical protein
MSDNHWVSAVCELPTASAEDLLLEELRQAVDQERSVSLPAADRHTRGPAGPGEQDGRADSADARLTEFADIAQQLCGWPSLEETLQAVLAQASRALRGDAFGILLVKDHTIQRVAASQPDVGRADQLQLDRGEGPVLEAVLRRRDVVVADLEADGRWRDWALQAVALGWRCTQTVALRQGDTIGALTVYARSTSTLGPPDLRLAQVFAAHASIAVAHARDRDNLTEALRGRTLIGQAQGILMEHYRVDAEQAFDVLRRYSSQGNRKLRQVAEEVVRERGLPSECQGSGNAAGSAGAHQRRNRGPEPRATGALVQRGHAGQTRKGEK